MMGGETAWNMYRLDNNKEYCITLHLVDYTNNIYLTAIGSSPGGMNSIHLMKFVEFYECCISLCSLKLPEDGHNLWPGRNMEEQRVNR
jgi:hypothetical protein